MSIRTRPATPQAGRHPLLMASRNGFIAAAAAGGPAYRVFCGRRDMGRAILAAADHAWLRGPAAVLADDAVGYSRVQASWQAMCRRILAGSGAGYVLDDALDPAVWFYARPGPAPTGCMGAAPGDAGDVTLLVGDVRAKRGGSGMPDWPFVSIVEGGCSHWLSAGTAAHEEKLCWINAYSVDFSLKPELAGLRQHKWRRVIAMGNHSVVACARVGIHAIRVHHPMHWWTHYRETRPYRLFDFLEGWKA